MYELPFLNLQFIENDYQSLNETPKQCMDFRIISTIESFLFFSIKHLFQKQVGLLTQILIKSWIYTVTIVSDIIIPSWNIRITENSLRPSPQPDFRQTKLSLGTPPPPHLKNIWENSFIYCKVLHASL